MPTLKDQLHDAKMVAFAEREASERALVALRECFILLNNSDVRHYISTDLGEQAALHRVLRITQLALAEWQKQS
jgi:hypothetical protein